MKCFHHDDADGRSSGAIVAMHEDNYDPANFFEVDYIQKLPIDKIGKDEKVYFVDYSFSVNTADVLRDILKITKNVIWIDHHNSSLKMIGKYPEFKSIKGIIREGISGAALTYMYLYGESYDNIPLFLKYVSDFDCWHLTMPNIMEFKYGFECYDYSALSDFWVRLMEHDSGTSNDFLDKIIEKGKIAKQYCENIYRSVRDKGAYEAKVEGYRACIINRDGFSDLFGEKMKEYDICIRWNYTGKKYSYSIYSSNPKIDVSKIAEKYGGGGHKGAAGMSSDKQLF